MRNRLIIFGLVLAIFIASTAWALQPVTGGTTTTGILNGRVTAVDASGYTVAIETSDSSIAYEAFAAGDRVQILAANPNAALPVKTFPPRRLLGVWLLAMAGTFVALRVRRRRTF